MDQEPGPERDSYRFFGNRHRATIWRVVTDFAIEPPEPFTYAEIAKRSRRYKPVPSTTVHKEVRLLEDFGMVERQGEYHGDAIVFHRVDSPFWQIAEATAAAFNSVYPLDIEQ